MKLVKYDEARRALAAAHKVDEVKSIRDRALAMQVYAKQANDAVLIDYATDIRKRAEIRAGELLAEMKARGERDRGYGDRKSGSQAATPKLEDLGVDKSQSSRWQKLAALSKEQQEIIIAKAKRMANASISGDKEAIKEARQDIQAEKLKRRAEREQELASKQAALPERKFGVILADPEWQFEAYSNVTGMDRSADNHYSTSETDVIAERNVQSIAADDCVLWLWATVPMMPQALQVMAAWGFTYKSQFVWIKDRIGTGYWSRNKHELLLIGTKGSIPAPAMGTQWNSAIEAPIGSHSEKPDIFYELIEAYFPNLPKIEMNARRARPGWEAWGFEAPMSEAAE